MSRYPTLSELAWPMDDESRLQAQEWANGIVSQVLDWTWRAFDMVRASALGSVDLTQSLEQLERDLARHHFREINILWAQETGGECAFMPHHEYPELETRSPAPAKPPAYDIAFVWNANPRLAWPIEAKVVPTANTLADYLGDVKKFTDGIAAPLSGIGAQIAYLLTGTTDDFFNNLRTRLSLPLQTLTEFSARAHRVSSHARKSSPDLQLHHMAMGCYS
ncbi:MAG TPA: hypothetical protein VHG89_01960 [Verrucomicrobiae bacterium]|nr:hypothetical protein [Verrucomicrobiae bacterium]